MKEPDRSTSKASLTIPSMIGPITVVADGDYITEIHIGRRRPGRDETPLLLETKKQLDAYFARRLTIFDLPTEPRGSDFERRLWRALERIPYGAVRTYGALAREVDSIPRAIGGACGANPIPIVIPCHRVIGSNSLGGYSGGDGVATKRKLLALEQPDLLSGLS
ncbi:MAG TPA: methylated-DNA--[protein]-cysteine S-methyltransferase [Alphaproteobacteria bacterium]|nr:methylated-DNA--[protein]-cysteine S-methyltransferase [Alphaproteobacteria bacterium]